MVKGGIATASTSGSVMIATGGTSSPITIPTSLAGVATAGAGGVVSGVGIARTTGAINNSKIDNAKIAEIKNSITRNRVYKPNLGKHKEFSKGKISADPFWNNEKLGQQMLDTAYSSKNTKQLYNVYNNELVKFQPGNDGTWHAYKVINTSTEVPNDVLRNMKNDGIISKSQYNKWVNNK